MQVLRRDVRDKLNELENKERNEDEDKLYEELLDRYDEEYVEKIYTDTKAFIDHIKYRPYVYKLHDFIRGADSDAKIYVKCVMLNRADYNKNKNNEFISEYVNYELDF